MDGTARASVRRGTAVVVVALVAAAAGCGGGTSRSTASDGLVDIGAGLRGPAGVKASVYAQAPANIAAFAFDPQGRLWVATANFTDAGGDGVYLIAGPGVPAMQVVAGLHTPLGLVWHDGSLYVASRERVDAYSDFDGTRFASQRTVLALPQGVGESNGLAVAPDGRLTMGISAPCDNCTPSLPWSGSCGLLPARRQRPSRRGRRHPGASRPRLLPRHERPVRHHEPARRSRSANAG